MTKILLPLIGSLTIVSALSADTCPPVSEGVQCFRDDYKIIEIEPNTHWPHHEMRAAHWIGGAAPSQHKRVRRVRHRHHALACR